MATNLVAGQSDTNGASDVFLYDQGTGATTLVSHNSTSATVTAFSQSDTPVISADGNYVAFISYAQNLVVGQNDTNNNLDVFLYNRVTGTNLLVSGSSSSATKTGNNFSDAPSLARMANTSSFAVPPRTWCRAKRRQRRSRRIPVRSGGGHNHPGQPRRRYAVDGGGFFPTPQPSAATATGLSSRAWRPPSWLAKATPVALWQCSCTTERPGPTFWSAVATARPRPQPTTCPNDQTSATAA